MKSERKGPMSRGRPEAAAEQSEDRVRTEAKPEALDSGTGELCVVQEAASKADPPRRAPPALRIQPPVGAFGGRQAAPSSARRRRGWRKERFRVLQVAALQRPLMCRASKPPERHRAAQPEEKGPSPMAHISSRCANDVVRFPAMTR